MFVTKKNKAFDEDLPAVIKKKPRCKKPRDKFSLMYTIPIQVLSLREEVNSGGKIKRGKRLGFSVYDSLACKQCKPNKFFHKRFGLTVHSKCAHGRDSTFKLPSVPSRSLTQRRSLTSNASRRTSAGAVRGRASAVIELIELEDENDTEEVEEIQIIDNIGNVVEEKKVVVKSIEPFVKNDHDNESDDDIECLDVVEANCGIKSYKPKQYLWMESSPLYQPKVFLLNSLNRKLRKEVSEDEIEEVNPLDDPNLSIYLNDNSVLVDLDSEEVEVSVLGDAEPIELEEAVFEKSPHIRNLFEEEKNGKRKSLGANTSPFKKIKPGHEDEMLLLEEPEEDFDEEVLDIQSMLEVSLDETEEQTVNVSNDEIEIIGKDVDENTNDSPSSKDEAEIAIVDVEEEPELQVELVTLDEDDNVEVEVNTGKVDSIRDLVNLWAASEEKSLGSQEAGTGKMRTKKRRSELKPYLTSRGL